MKPAKKMFKTKRSSAGEFYKAMPYVAKQGVQQSQILHSDLAATQHKLWARHLRRSHQRGNRKERFMRRFHDDLTPLQIAVSGSILATSIIALIAGTLRFIVYLNY